jgi:two-component system chemotaxis response regulator CheB
MNTPSKKIRLLIVDDSALARRVISSSLEPFPDIEVVGTAMNPYVARDRILELKPDVITLDLEMPRMDGMTFLRIIMKHRPMPVIIMSSLTKAGSAKALEALQSGAVDVMDKPAGSASAHADGIRLAEKIRAAASAKVSYTGDDAEHISPDRETVVKNPVSSKLTHHNGRELILLGASTGGTVALTEVLKRMSGDLPGICVVQHIPAHFSAAFAERLNQVCPMEVREAQNGDVIKRGLALVAPGGYHMLVRWAGMHYVVELNQGPQLHFQRPAVDILFDSAVRAGAGPYVTAAVLTGMGSDGAAGLLRLKEKGAATIAQNEQTCVVFGMPREAIKIGAAQMVLPLLEIGPRLVELATSPVHAH